MDYVCYNHSSNYCVYKYLINISVDETHLQSIFCSKKRPRYLVRQAIKKTQIKTRIDKKASSRFNRIHATI